MSSRIPSIAKNVLEHHQHRFTSDQVEQLTELYHAMVNDQAIQRISDAQDDSQMWLSELDKYKGYTWLKMPWFLSESYFFRLLLEFSGYFSTGFDPFSHNKEAELTNPVSWKHLDTALTCQSSSISPEEAFEFVMKCCLWGNKADGCYKKVQDTLSKNSESLHSSQDDLILVNDTLVVLKALQSRSHIGTIAFINDNAGTELLLDLALADFLLSNKWADKIVFQLKARPTYVSDATIQDVKTTIDRMKGSSEELYNRMQEYMSDGRLELRDHLFWNSFKFFFDLPQDLIQEFKTGCDFVFIKGDANYRRLVGDRNWPVTTPVHEAIPYFPQSFVSLRTLKSDPIVGIPANMHEELEKTDALWRVNGKRGLIQAVIITD